MLVAFVPAVSAQGSDYSVTAKEAYKHAYAYMIEFIGTNSPGFENWQGASIDSKPLELYDINGKKLFYQYSVSKSNKVIGKIDVCADKTLGSSVNAFEFEPAPFKATEAMKKSIEIAKTKYPTGEIKSTLLVVYSYPSIGAMTVVKDKATKVEYRVFVDAYTLNEIEDKPATDTNPGVWSVYESASKNGVDNNVKAWQKSAQLTNTIEQLSTNKGVDTYLPVTEENVKKLSVPITEDMKTLSTSATTVYPVTKSLSVPLIAQQNSVYCGPASIQMVVRYKNLSPVETQYQIYHNHYSGGRPDEVGGLSASGVTDYCKHILNKWGSRYYEGGSFSTTTLMNEIYNGRPYISAISGHWRVCKGYNNVGYAFYLYINDPMPVNQGSYRLEYYGSEVIHVYVKD